jgi:putative Holliday junction resolvase
MPDRRAAQESAAAPQVVLAFDFGLRRIGIACGNTLTRTARPLAALDCTGTQPDWMGIGREIERRGASRLVVGCPYNTDGSASHLTHAAREFASELKNRYRLPVDQVDERYSSLEAGAALAARRGAGERRRRVRREDVDGAAAAVILDRWFAGEGESGT